LFTTFSWLSAPLNEIIPSLFALEIENIGRVFFANQTIVAASPNFYNTTFDRTANNP
jgi:hypothetical protein